MPDKCCVTACRSNYDNTKEYVSVFKFPKDESLKKLWISKIPRKNWNPSNRAVVCEKHFNEEEIIRYDELPKDGEVIKIPRKNPKLKKDVYPSIFLGCPSYLTKKKAPTRLSRDEKLEAIDRKKLQDFLEKDQILHFEELKRKLQDKVKSFDEGLILKVSDADLYILYINFNDVPSIKYSVKIDVEMRVRVCIGNAELKNVYYSHHLDSEMRLTRWSQLENIFKTAEVYASESDGKKKLDAYEKAIELWDTFISNTASENSFTVKHFLKEQMILCTKSQFAKRYSTDLLTFSFSLYIKSAVMYKSLYKLNMLCLPSVDTLKKLNPFKINQSLMSDGNYKYLQEKCSRLDENEKIVNLLIDEIYIKPNIIYKGKTLTGFAENSSSEATSIQSFMVSSIFSHYKEIVALVPVTNMTSDDLYNYTCEVLKLLDGIGINVLCIISDNNRVNRKMFEQISGSKIFNCVIKNPVNSNPLFLLFDTVHLIKSVRNNWINQNNAEKTFLFPDFEGEPSIKKAHFCLLRKLFQLEKDSLIKYAPKLNYKSVYPKNIERQNVSLALNIFDENNIVALDLYSKESTQIFDWNDTAVLLKIFKKWWDIVNVGHLMTGIVKRKDDSKPFDSINDERFEFLEKFSKWIKVWKEQNLKPRCGCLSNETCFALEHTTSTLILVIKYLLQNDTKFVLTAKFQTDNLESRFGEYRQMSGANFHVSLQEVLESERKLRLKSVLQLHSHKHGDIPLKLFLSSYSLNIHNITEDVSSFISVLDEINLDVITHRERDIIIFIAGYCSFKLNLSCTECILIFLSSDNLFVESNIPAITADTENFLSLVNRGGLKFPSSFVVEIISYSYIIFQNLSGEEFENSFLSSNLKQHSVFVRLCEIYLLDNCIVSNEKCNECGESIIKKLKILLDIFGNICLNNYAKITKDKRISETDDRKLKKFKK